MARFGRSQPINVYYSDDITTPVTIDLGGAAGTASDSATGSLTLTTSIDGSGAAANTTQALLGFVKGPIDLRGQGTAASAVTDQLRVTAVVDGNGTASDSGTAFLLQAAKIDGNGTASDSGTADIIVGPVPGYLAWYDATDPLTITGAVGVSAWADKSGNGYHLIQPTDFERPSTGIATIRFNNALFIDQFVTTQGLTASGLSITGNTISVFVAAQAVETPDSFDPVSGDPAPFTDNRLISFTDGVQSDWDNTAGLSAIDFLDDGTFYDNVQVVSAVGFADTRAFVYTLVRNGTTWTTHRDGNVLPTSTTVATNFNIVDMGVGGIPAGADVIFPASGLVGEILIYNAALTAPQITQIESYLISKWLVRGTTFVAGHGDNTSAGTAVLVTGFLGQGTAAAAATNQLTYSAGLTVHGDATSGGGGDLTVIHQTLVQITGQGTASATGSASTVLASALAGTGAVASGATNLLTLTATLQGHGDAAAAVTVLLRAALGLTGHGDNSSTGVVDLIVRNLVLAGSGTAAASTANNLLRLAATLAGHGNAAVAAGTPSLFGVVQDPDPFTLTIHDDGHMDTIWDRDHTTTLVDS